MILMRWWIMVIGMLYHTLALAIHGREAVVSDGFGDAWIGFSVMHLFTIYFLRYTWHILVALHLIIAHCYFSVICKFWLGRPSFAFWQFGPHIWISIHLCVGLGNLIPLQGACTGYVTNFASLRGMSHDGINMFFEIFSIGWSMQNSSFEPWDFVWP